MQTGGMVMEDITARDQILKLNKIGIALTSMHDLDGLLELIVTEARGLTNSDAGSLYIRDGDVLRFSVSQSDLLRERLGAEGAKALFKPFTLPLSRHSLAGYVASTGEVINLVDVYRIPRDRVYRFNRDFDERNDYRTQSMLVVPMKDQEDSIIGVLQLINALNSEGRVATYTKQHEELIQSLASQAAVAIQNAQLTMALKKAHYDTILRLSVAAEYRDEDTAMHITRVSQYSATLGRQLGLPPSEVELLLYASPMHDVGKLGIPDSILLKPGKLTADERKVMETHTIIGANILAPPDSPIMAASEEVALSHHEKFDGSGYPSGLKGDGIPLNGRIVALADVFDALSTQRVYKPAFDMDRALNILKEDSGKHFDPDVVAAFFDTFDRIMEIKAEYPETTAGDAAQESSGA
jgi:putative two-component system response regulator